jgi:hypothetical protein
MTTPAPITDAGLAELERRLACLGGHTWECIPGHVVEGNSQVRNKADEWLLCELPGDDYAYVIAHFLTDGPSLVHRLRTSEAENVALRACNADWWRQSKEQKAEIAALQARAEKAEAEVARLVKVLEAEQMETRRLSVLANALQKCGCLQAKHAALEVERLPTSRPDPAQPGRSSAQPAADYVRRADVVELLRRLADKHAELALYGKPESSHLREAMEAALTKARHDIVNLSAHPNMIPTADPNDPDAPCEPDATPPATGSAAGKGE